MNNLNVQFVIIAKQCLLSIYLCVTMLDAVKMTINEKYGKQGLDSRKKYITALKCMKSIIYV